MNDGDNEVGKVVQLFGLNSVAIILVRLKCHELQNGDGPDWETGTQYSQDSQSSQEDLAALGIKREDLKAVFIKKAMDKFSNAQVCFNKNCYCTIYFNDFKQ